MFFNTCPDWNFASSCANSCCACCDFGKIRNTFIAALPSKAFAASLYACFAEVITNPKEWAYRQLWKLWNDLHPLVSVARYAFHTLFSSCYLIFNGKDWKYPCRKLLAAVRTSGTFTLTECPISFVYLFSRYELFRCTDTAGISKPLRHIDRYGRIIRDSHDSGIIEQIVSGKHIVVCP